MPENIHTKIKGMRSLASMDGAVFDVEEDQSQMFDDAFEHAKESGKRLNFTVEKCKTLPDLLDMDSGRGGRGGYGGQQSYGGRGRGG